MAHALSPDFRVLFEKSPGLYLVLDPHFFVVAATDNYLEATVKARENIVGQHLFDVLPESPNEAHAIGLRSLRNSLERVLRDRVADSMAVQRCDIRLASGEFEERYWSAVNTPVLDLHNCIKYIVHAIEDVTAFVQGKTLGRETSDVTNSGVRLLLRSEQLGAINDELKLANEELALRTAQLNDALQTMETFTYSIAHDLRGPLRAMVVFSNMVVEECSAGLGDPGKDYIKRISEAARRMDRLVSDLLVYGRLTHVEATSVPISLDSAITRVLDDLTAEIEGRNAVVEVDRPLPTIMGSPVLLNHVLVNLMDNATKFMPPDRTPRVLVRSRVTEDCVRLSIIDNGIGIASEYHAKIFDLFMRLHKPSEYSGTGIGLALVRRAMDRMLGKVGLESTPGQGSCFWLEFRAPK